MIHLCFVATDTGGWCPHPPVEVVTAGCVHEHVQTGGVCSRHLEDTVAPDQLGCNVCTKAGHDCDAVILERRPVDQTVSA